MYEENFHKNRKPQQDDSDFNSAAFFQDRVIVDEKILTSQNAEYLKKILLKNIDFDEIESLGVYLEVLRDKLLMVREELTKEDPCLPKRHRGDLANCLSHLDDFMTYKDFFGPSADNAMYNMAFEYWCDTTESLDKAILYLDNFLKEEEKSLADLVITDSISEEKQDNIDDILDDCRRYLIQIKQNQENNFCVLHSFSDYQDIVQSLRQMTISCRDDLSDTQHFSTTLPKCLLKAILTEELRTYKSFSSDFFERFCKNLSLNGFVAFLSDGFEETSFGQILIDDVQGRHTPVISMPQKDTVLISMDVPPQLYLLWKHNFHKFEESLSDLTHLVREIGCDLKVDFTDDASDRIMLALKIPISSEDSYINDPLKVFNDNFQTTLKTTDDISKDGKYQVTLLLKGDQKGSFVQVEFPKQNILSLIGRDLLVKAISDAKKVFSDKSLSKLIILPPEEGARPKTEAIILDYLGKGQGGDSTIILPRTLLGDAQVSKAFHELLEMAEVPFFLFDWDKQSDIRLAALQQIKAAKDVIEKAKLCSEDQQLKFRSCLGEEMTNVCSVQDSKGQMIAKGVYQKDLGAYYGRSFSPFMEEYVLKAFHDALSIDKINSDKPVFPSNPLFSYIYECGLAKYGVVLTDNTKTELLNYLSKLNILDDKIALMNFYGYVKGIIKESIQTSIFESGKWIFFDLSADGQKLVVDK